MKAEEIEERFDPGADDIGVHGVEWEDLIYEFGELAKKVNFACADGREKSTCLSRLEEAMMWGGKAVQRKCVKSE